MFGGYQGLYAQLAHPRLKDVGEVVISFRKANEDRQTPRSRFAFAPFAWQAHTISISTTP
jgi:hypothetical protein